MSIASDYITKNVASAILYHFSHLNNRSSAEVEIKDNNGYTIYVDYDYPDGNVVFDAYIMRTSRGCNVTLVLSDDDKYRCCIQCPLDLNINPTDVVHIVELESICLFDKYNEDRTSKMFNDSKEEKHG